MGVGFFSRKCRSFILSSALTLQRRSVVQRLAQERDNDIHAADVLECSDMTALLDRKKQGWRAAFAPEDVAKYPADQRDPDGFIATVRFTLSLIEYNTKLIKPDESLMSFADLLDQEWKGQDCQGTSRL
jgi:iron(III) transport system substrate-binding protein